MKAPCIILSFLAAGGAVAQWKEATLGGMFISSTGFEVWQLELKKEGKAEYAYNPDHPGGQPLSGTWTFGNDLVTVNLAGKSRRGKMIYHRWRFVPVKWGQRLYLISEDEIRDFAGETLHWRDEHRDAGSQKRELHRAPFMRDLQLAPKRWGKAIAPGRFQAWFD